ncbi:MAG: Fe-S-containing hydro-lyase [Candidatus Omnitrophota bacterium]|jgi:fumarate hydratase subunit beta|nr:Fe-S-containing hydro-lyase [Candidatus Omnitrophota bacterium]
MSIINIKTPLTVDIRKELKAGDEVLLTGTILTARDAAHKRLRDILKKGKPLPLNLKDAVIYYCGPTPARPGRAIGSCGPTTSSRMDHFTTDLIELGLGGMIGKGDRSDEVKAAIKKHKCVYFLATGGIGALLSTKVKSSKVILYGDLGPEAIHKLEVKDFPLLVGIDSRGTDIYPPKH